MWQIEDKFGYEDRRRFWTQEEAQQAVITDLERLGVGAADINWQTIGIVEVEDTLEEAIERKAQARAVADAIVDGIANYIETEE